MLHSNIHFYKTKSIPNTAVHKKANFTFLRYTSFNTLTEHLRTSSMNEAQVLHLLTTPWDEYQYDTPASFNGGNFLLSVYFWGRCVIDGKLRLTSIQWAKDCSCKLITFVQLSSDGGFCSTSKNKKTLREQLKKRLTVLLAISGDTF